MITLQGLWGGALPRFEDLETAKKLISLLINGLWNSLTRHQKRTQPFRLVRPPIEPTPAGISAFGLIRQQELDGFVEGLFNGDDNIALPESACRSLDVLAEARGMMVGVYGLANDPTKCGPEEDLTKTIRNLQKITPILEREIHAIILSCTKARKDMLSSSGLAGSKPN